MSRLSPPGRALGPILINLAWAASAALAINVVAAIVLLGVGP